MHEMSIAETILELIGEEMGHYPGARLLAFDIQVGELSCCQEESLRFCLEASLQQSDWAGSEVRIATEPVGARCRACQSSFRPAENRFLCPTCGGADVEVVGGQEVHLKSLEIDT
jgi:hydrogenase nickel incorporation protein HypA/HybF